ncbi:MAG: hypothetical protein WCQ41_06270 [Bacillota bacterium]
MVKKLKCPICGFRVIDSESEVKTELRVIKDSEEWKPDYLGKCRSCKQEIGLKKLN